MLIAAAALIGVISFAWRGSGTTARYKLTVQLTTPDSPVTASVVREVRLQKDALKLPESSGMIAKRVGQALPIQIGGRTLFVLNLRNVEATLLQKFPALANGRTGPSPAVDLPLSGPEAVELPRMVWFDNPSDPATVHEISPSQLSSVLGEGTALRRISIQLTEEPVTRGIDEVLPWLRSYQRKRLRLSGKSGPIKTHDLADRLGPGDFIQGIS